jgi:hypothetical protein
LIPAATPFFGDSMSLNFKSLQGDIRPLVLGIDFYLSHYFLGASRAEHRTARHGHLQSVPVPGWGVVGR